MPETINCIALDDEPLALSQIATYIKRIPYLSLVATCADAFEAMQALNAHPVQLMFVDINMPDLNGMEFVRSLSQRPLVVFTTAYSEYALEGFKVEAVDYLLKPFGFGELLSAADKARRRLDTVIVPPTTSSTDDAIFVKSDFRTIRIRFDDIKYIEGMSEYVRIYLEGDAKPLMPLLNMRNLEETLPADRFMRVHRSYIVNLRKITEITRQRIVFGDKFIPIGDNYKERFQEYLAGRTLK